MNGYFLILKYSKIKKELDIFYVKLKSNIIGRNLILYGNMWNLTLNFVKRIINCDHIETNNPMEIEEIQVRSFN